MRKLAQPRELVPEAIDVFLLSCSTETDLCPDLEVLTPEERRHAAQTWNANPPTGPRSKP